MNYPVSRRQFVKTSLLGAAALGVSARSWAQVAGANDTLRVAVIGVNGRGRSHISGFNNLRGVRVVALCDADEAILRREAENLNRSNRHVDTYVDFRHVLENPDIDAVSIATPNHTHALMSVWACQAGKDVFVEKPVSHNVWEGRKIVEAAEKHRRIVQTGTQIRSSEGIAEAVAWVKAGNIGKVTAARGLCYKRRDSIGSVGNPPPPPASVNYDLWSGPAPLLPTQRSRFHYDWHWIWAYGNGDLGNQGIHQVDVARWFLGENELSPRVLSVGGRLGYEDDGETPNTLISIHDYPGRAPLIFEVRGLPARRGSNDMDDFFGSSVGNIIHCEGGFVVVPSYTQAIAYDASGRRIRSFDGPQEHYGNFVKAVRSRRSSDLTAPIIEGHLSSALCHTANISYLLGTERSSGEAAIALKKNPAAQEAFARMESHLGRNGLSAAENRVTLGRFLEMDPRTEKFKGDAEANRLLTRDYRAPFTIKV